MKVPNHLSWSGREHLSSQGPRRSQLKARKEEKKATEKKRGCGDRVVLASGSWTVASLNAKPKSNVEEREDAEAENMDRKEEERTASFMLGSCSSCWAEGVVHAVHVWLRVWGPHRSCIRLIDCCITQHKARRLLHHSTQRGEGVGTVSSLHPAHRPLHHSPQGS